MAETIKAMVLHAARDLRLEQREISPPGIDELQVVIKHTGLCGSDLHYYNHFANGNIQVREPLILGHESAGIVAAVGSAVPSADFKIGDRVALEVGVPCERCELCQKNRYNLCANMRFRSSAKSMPHFQGTLQTKINHPARWCHKMPDTMSEMQGALLEPLAVALHAIKRTGLTHKNPQTVLVFGAGTIGLLIARCLRLDGHQVIIADISDSRIKFAQQNGLADRGVVLPNRRRGTDTENLQNSNENKDRLCETLQELHDRRPDAPVTLFDATFECTGIESCVQTGIYATKPGGKIALVGMGQPIQTLPLAAAALREVDILGVFRYAGSYRDGIALFQTGRLKDVERLVTHHFQGIDSVPQACELAAVTEDDRGRLVLKVMIDH